MNYFVGGVILKELRKQVQPIIQETSQASVFSYRLLHSPDQAPIIPTCNAVKLKEVEDWGKGGTEQGAEDIG